MKMFFRNVIVLNILLCGMLLMQASFAQTLRDVRIQSGKEGFTLVSMEGDKLPKPSVNVWKGHYLVIEFPARFAGKGKQHRVQSPHATYVRYGWYTNTPPRSRVVLTMKGNPSYTVQKSDKGYYLALSHSKDSMDDLGQAMGEAMGKAFEEMFKVLGEALGEAFGSEEPNAETQKTPKRTEVASQKPVMPKATKKPANQGTKAADTTQVPTRTVNTFAPNVPAHVTMPPVEPKISLDFVGAEIGDVLKALAIQSGANIVTGNDVKGTITVSLNNVTVDESLDLITRLSSYQYKKLGSTYVVGTPKSLESFGVGSTNVRPAQQETIIEVVRIQYGDLATIAQAVSAMMADIDEDGQFRVFASSGSSGKEDKGGGSGGADKGGGGGSSGTKSWDPRQDRFLVLTGTNNMVPIGRRFAEQLDQQYGEAMRSGHVIEIYQSKHVDASTLKDVLEGKLHAGGGSSGGGSGGGEGGSGGGNSGGGSSGGESGGLVYPLFPTVRISLGPVPAITGHNVSVAQVSSQQNATGSLMQANKTIEPPMTLVFQGPSQDVQRALAFAHQVDVAVPQVRIEARVVDLSDRAMRDLGISWGLTQASGVNPARTQGIQFNRQGDLAIQFDLIKSPIQLDATLNAVFEDRRNKLLASPNITVMDGRYAEIFIGDEIRYVESITQSTTGPSITVGVVKAGIQLNVSPRINPTDNTITLNLHPEVSLVTGFLDAPGGGQLPQIARRYADTTVRIADGDTIVIGGLIREDDIKTVQKVPLLGDLPIIGMLFRRTSTQKDKSEIVMMIKIQILKE
jgi:type II secretory pathway component GspD/PulD (secretin)